MATGKLYCGTSGFAYPTWKPGFYPAKLPAAKFLSHYAGRLNAVEANYSYRKLVPAGTYAKWIAATPEGFLFLPKAHQNITHRFRLEGAEEFTGLFIASLAPLKDVGRLGPVLFQLPPNLKFDGARLSRFLQLLPGSCQWAFEFRHESWFHDETYAILRHAGAALCLAENEKLETPDILTAGFVYLRLRKPDYAQAELNELESRISGYRTSGRTVYAIFKHEDTPDGALNAERLLHSQNGRGH